MKTLSAFVIAMALLAVGCKKDSTRTAAKTWLLSKATYTVTAGGNVGKIYMDVYTYDSKNRLTTINSQWSGGITFNYTYNGDNTLALATATYNSDGSSYYVGRYTYSGNTIKDSCVYVNGLSTNIQLLTLNSSGQVQSYNLNAQASSDSYTYDSKGNVTNFKIMGNPGNYLFTYDDKKSPFSMIGAKNIDMMYFMNNVPQTNVNNPLTSDSGLNTYAYTYNSAGFPVTVNVMVGDPHDAFSYTVAYEYITK